MFKSVVVSCHYLPYTTIPDTGKRYRQSKTRRRCLLLLGGSEETVEKVVGGG